MKHNPKNWLMVGCLQIGLLVGGFNLPNNIINGTWFGSVIDIARIAGLFGLPVGDSVLVIRLLAIGKRKKTYLRQFIDPSNYGKYDLIDPIHFINLNDAQMTAIEQAFEQSRDDLIFDTNFPFQSLQKYIQGSQKHV